ncbi:MAG: HyaD/HybD family hydrogenase maturation endopeptidase [Sulfuricurvum sp.]|jgi:hydrogenase maturation protease|uniref:HyaD/HybD family hydrogenase maturation endopeptidase n=1 Tax=Sulfuricurvum sp. TaxID=2025608 RepID=UPI0025EB9828|nr:HyaD/HybD family hydrogenase maturation endopeptidase [Sulfuricurvum sp.]MCK9373743.1 HyaD/HybD family hydrogenase maturation endopeptidase [Sulfuricurvum sp.]
MSNTVVVGVGNILFMDEGVGVYAGKYLEENFAFNPPIDIIDGGVLGFKLMTYYQSYDRVIILDTVTIDDEAGSIYHLPADALMGLGSYRQTAHEVEVVEMLEICSLLDKMADVSVVGIIPHDIQSVVIDLTDRVKGQFDPYIQTVLGVLRDAGVEATPKEEAKSLNRIINAYANPTMAAF